MEFGVIVVVIIRSLLSSIILKFPLFGGIVAIAVDYIDLDLLKLLNSNLDDYQIIDKVLDVYYLSLEAYVVTSWKNILVKRISLLLFSYRVLGFIIFLVSQNLIFLVIFPNVFEFFYLFYLSFKKFYKADPVISVKGLSFILVSLLLFKIIHEYFLHINTTYPWTDNKYVKLIFK